MSYSISQRVEAFDIDAAHETERIPLAAGLAVTGTILLVASQISDWLEPYLGFDGLNLFSAFLVGAMVAGYGAVGVCDLLNHPRCDHGRCRSLSRRRASRSPGSQRSR